MAVITIRSGFLYLLSKGPSTSDNATVSETQIITNGNGFVITIVPTRATPIKVISEKMDKEKPFPSSEKGDYGEYLDNTSIFEIGRMKETFDVNGVLKLKDLDGTVINDYSSICSRTDENNLERYLNILRRMLIIQFVRGDSKNWDSKEPMWYYECSLMKYEITYRGSDVGIMEPGSSVTNINQADIHLLLVRSRAIGGQ